MILKNSEIKKYKGKIKFDVNLDGLRDRKNKRFSLKEFKKKALSDPEVEQEYNRATSVCKN